MYNIEVNFILNIFIAFAVAYIISIAEANAKRLKKIELLLSKNFLNEASAIDQDIVQLAKNGNTKRAAIVYRERHDVSLREAELAIESIKGSMV